MEITEENGQMEVNNGALLTPYESLINVDDLITMVGKPSIFEIPKTLYRHNKTAYLPNAFSFGPLHYRKPDLQATQALKFTVLRDKLSRCNDPKAKLAELERAVCERLLEVRQCYAKQLEERVDENKFVEIDDDKFAKILVLDGCFIIELFFNEYDRQDYQQYHQRSMEEGFLLYGIETQAAYLFQCLYHDLILLENQIPWFVLELLSNLLYGGDSKLKIRKGAIRFFSKMFSHDGLSIPPALLEKEKVEHILDLLRKCLFLSSLRDEKNVQSSFLPSLIRFLFLPLWKLLLVPLWKRVLLPLLKPVFLPLRKHVFLPLWEYLLLPLCRWKYLVLTLWALEQLWDFLRQWKYLVVPLALLMHLLDFLSEHLSSLTSHLLEFLQKLLEFLQKLLIAPQAQVSEMEMQVPSASRLKEAGVKFKRGRSLRLDIKFQKGVLEIPSLLIHDSRETIFRNMIAFEQCYRGCHPIVTSYAKLMDNLIDTVEDIDILRKNGIICNSLNPEDATKFFNSLYNSTYISHNHYADIYKDVNCYCQRWWPRWRAFYIHNYLGKPWAIFSQIFALLILALTILQVIHK
ncbi:hypothetical protein SLEP1_g10623 [Rubroshorea leprosula]|uniref:Uncharacterized protein n=1 Tax=Rubroshorea leprosula TaxID=152421 RepID=A0AAV5IJJ7_9ROSI|nr:hypothetical protein SLEP1_g10623 [Rubroshorea leprosula]